jgi:hypothetical protein
MKEWSMTSVNHWERVNEAAVGLNFRRAFGRARTKMVGGGLAGKRRRRG